METLAAALLGLVLPSVLYVGIANIRNAARKSRRDGRR